MKFIAIIPARYGSSRFPGKPLADIKGKPMIQRVYEQVTKVLVDVYVATDDERIAKVVKFFGGKVVMTSGDHQSGTDRCEEAIGLIESVTGENFDVVINVQGDEPYLEPEQIEKVIDCFDGSGTQIATLVHAIDKAETIFDPNKPKVVLNNKKEAIYFSRSPIPFVRNTAQDEWVTAHTYWQHIGLYAYRKDVLKELAQLNPSTLEKAESLEQLRWVENGYTIRTEITDIDSQSIDTPEDLDDLLVELDG